MEKINKLKFLKLKEHYLFSKNQLGGTAPRDLESEEQKSQRQDRERRALLSVDRNLVYSETRRIIEALRKKRTHSIDHLSFDVFVHILSYLNLEDLSNMFVAFNQANSKELQKAAMIKDFLKGRVTKILKYLEQQRLIIKNLTVDDIKELDRKGFNDLRNAVDRYNFNTMFLIRQASVSTLQNFGYLHTYKRYSNRFSPQDEFIFLSQNGYFDFPKPEPIVFHKEFKITENEVKTALNLGFIQENDIPYVSFFE